ncbi:hypothetical protein OPV22_018258 [Ensete ventricosum]|uniref:Uncharacterized protein n=1 Tax=Ensete ventricosum TaxID=4639 RepID=A0AAV8QZ53_ENSVE|nr:hypothetical protein OPV22_018258 [Ensete ventricosum]
MNPACCGRASNVWIPPRTRPTPPFRFQVLGRTDRMAFISPPNAQPGERRRGPAADRNWHLYQATLKSVFHGGTISHPLPDLAVEGHDGDYPPT